MGLRWVLEWCLGCVDRCSGTFVAGQVGLGGYTLRVQGLGGDNAY